MFTFIRDPDHNFIAHCYVEDGYTWYTETFTLKADTKADAKRKAIRTVDMMAHWPYPGSETTIEIKEWVP